jgi:hypothetical protein
MNRFLNAMLILGVVVGVPGAFVIGYNLGRSEQAASEKRVQDRIARASFRSASFHDQITDATARLAREHRVPAESIMSNYQLEVIPDPQASGQTICVLLMPKDFGVGGDATYCYRSKTTVLIR